MMRNTVPFALTTAIALLAGQSRGQISVTGGGLSYTQNFDMLTTNTTAQNWTDNTATTSAFDSPQVIGLAGWYAAGFASQAAAGPNSYVPQIRAGTGSSSTGSFYSFGSTGDSDRALGTLPQDSITGAGAGALRLGVRFVNNTGQNITGFTFSYDGEQWRNSSVTNIHNEYTVGYAVFGPGMGTLANPYVSTAAIFGTPFDGTGSPTAAALDGNAAANRVAGLGDTITGLSVTPGNEIWIRWSDANSASLDAGIAVDNFSITFQVPEPSVAVFLSLGLLCIFRRAGRN